MYTTLANMKTRAGSVYNTCEHENLSEQSLQHLQTRTLEGSAYSTCKHEHLRAVRTAPANTKTYVGSACSNCKHKNVSGQCIQPLRKLGRAEPTAPANTNAKTSRHENFGGQCIRRLLMEQQAPAVTTAQKA